MISYQDELDVGLVATVDAVPDAPAMAAAMLDELALLERAVLG